MQQNLTRLAIFSVSFWLCWAALAYLTNPTDQSGQLHVPVIISFFVLIFGAILCTSTLIISAYKTTRPNQKLPHLLIRDSLIQGLIIAVGATGLLVLQLLRVATLLNVGLWLGILFCVEWFLRQHQAKPRLNHRVEEDGTYPG